MTQLSQARSLLPAAPASASCRAFADISYQAFPEHTRHGAQATPTHAAAHQMGARRVALRARAISQHDIAERKSFSIFAWPRQSAYVMPMMPSRRRPH